MNGILKRRNLINLMSLLFGIIFISSCSCGRKEKPITVTGQNGQVYTHYQTACAAHDFVAAHQYLAELKSQEDSYHVKRGRKNHDKYLLYSNLLDEGEKYVFQQEAMYLMTLEDEDFASKRIVFLLKEAGTTGNDDRCNWLMDLAIDMDREGAVKSLTRLYNGKIPENVLEKVVEYLYVQKGEQNLNFLSSLLNQNGHMGILINTVFDKGSDELAADLAKRYGECIDLDDKSVITKLASRKDRGLSDAIIKSLSAIAINGRPYPIGLHDRHDPDREWSSGNQDKISHFQYVDSVADYNRQCDNLLSIAIASGNQYLAQKVLTCFKEKPVFVVGSDETVIKAPNGKRIDYSHSYMYYSDEDKKAAQKKYQEAVASGSFR